MSASPEPIQLSQDTHASLPESSGIDCDLTWPPYKHAVTLPSADDLGEAQVMQLPGLFDVRSKQ